MGDWRTTTVGEFCEFAYGKALKESDRSQTGEYPVLGSGGRSGSHKEALIDGPTTVVGRKGTVGATYFEPDGCWPIDTTFFVRPTSEQDARFTFYLLSWLDLRQMNSDSAVPGLNRDAAHALPIAVPPLPEQRAIAEILGALDDKIESNRRAIDLTIQLCDSKFLEWRVRHLPLDVETTFDDFCDVFGGATPKTSEPAYWGGSHAWATPSDVTALDSVYLFGTGRTITDEGLDRCSASLHPPGSIFMTSRATIGAFAVNQVPCVPNQGFIVVRPKEAAHRWFLLHEMRSRVPEMLDQANGSTFQELSRGSFKGMPLVLPADDAAFASLDRELSPLHERACIAARESAVAASLRDALLPELLSGRIRVPEARELVEDAS